MRAHTLKELTLPPHAKDFEILPAFTNLDRLGYRENSNWQPDQTPAQLWQSDDARAVS